MWRYLLTMTFKKGNQIAKFIIQLILAFLQLKLFVIPENILRIKA